MKRHTYKVRVDWTGNTGTGTESYRGYRRDYTVASQGKVSIHGSSAPQLRGDPTRFNPEELFVASLSSCHMLGYLHLCADEGIVVLEYQDDAAGIMDETADGSGMFTQVILKPKTRIVDHRQRAKAVSLHDDAHRLCFIACSVKCEVSVVADVTALP